MSHYAYRLLVAITIFFSSASLYARVVEKNDAYLIDSLEMSLKYTKTPSDSIRTLLNIYDLSPSKRIRTEILHRIADIARANKRVDVLLDALIHTANNNTLNDSLLDKIEQEIRGISNSQRQKEALLFVRLVKKDLEAKNYNGGREEQLVNSLIKQYASDTAFTAYKKAELLYSICIYLGKTSHGELLEEYISRLNDLLDTMDLTTGSVRNYIYTRAAPIFTANGKAEQAVAIDKRMLNIIDSLTTSYAAQGRPYRKMNTAKYAIYRRMLANYKALQPAEIEKFYNDIHTLREHDKRIDNDMKTNESVELFYQLARGNYPEAIDAIKRQMRKPGNEAYHDYYLNALVEAAAATGDKETQLEASTELIDSLRSQLARRTDERYCELQVVYDIAELRKENAELQIKREKSRLNYTRLVLFGAVIAAIVLAIVSIMLFRQNRKLRKLAGTHFQNTVRLRAERNELRAAQQELIIARDQAKMSDKLKSEFINNMSHEIKTPLTAIMEYTRLIVDCIPDGQKKYLDRFAYTVEQNSKLILTIVNDVTDMAALEHGSIVISKKPSSIHLVCTLALDSIFENERESRKGVAVVFNPSDKPDCNFPMDQLRVCQVLMNLLSNADKFTDEGSITLDYDVDKENGRLTFIITDTGIGVPDNCEDLIFERFRQIDPSTRGCGLGLYISRLFATLMGGEVVLDTNYHCGARFIFIIQD